MGSVFLHWFSANGAVSSGTVLGSILFLKMLNDLSSDYKRRWKFPDDTSVSEVRWPTTVTSKTNCLHKKQEELLSKAKFSHQKPNYRVKSKISCVKRRCSRQKQIALVEGEMLVSKTKCSRQKQNVRVKKKFLLLTDFARMNRTVFWFPPLTM